MGNHSAKKNQDDKTTKRGRSFSTFAVIALAICVLIIAPIIAVAGGGLDGDEKPEAVVAQTETVTPDQDKKANLDNAISGEDVKTEPAPAEKEDAGANEPSKAEEGVSDTLEGIVAGDEEESEEETPQVVTDFFKAVDDFAVALKASKPDMDKVDALGQKVMDAYEAVQKEGLEDYEGVPEKLEEFQALVESITGGVEEIAVFTPSKIEGTSWCTTTDLDTKQTIDNENEAVRTEQGRNPELYAKKTITSSKFPGIVYVFSHVQVLDKDKPASKDDVQKSEKVVAVRYWNDKWEYSLDGHTFIELKDNKKLFFMYYETMNTLNNDDYDAAVTAKDWAWTEAEWTHLSTTASPYGWYSNTAKYGYGGVQRMDGSKGSIMIPSVIVYQFYDKDGKRIEGSQQRCYYSGNFPQDVSVSILKPGTEAEVKYVSLAAAPKIKTAYTCNAPATFAAIDNFGTGKVTHLDAEQLKAANGNFKITYGAPNVTDVVNDWKNIKNQQACFVAIQLKYVTYTVTYENGYDGGVYKTFDDCESSCETPRIANPTRDGYTFVKWVNKADKNKGVSASVTSDVTYEATWTPTLTDLSYTVNHVVDDKVMDTFTGTKESVWVKDPQTLELVAEHMADQKYTGYKVKSVTLDGDPVAAGATVNSGSVITVTYEPNYDDRVDVEYTVEHVYEGNENLNSTGNFASTEYVLADPKMIAIEDGSLAPKEVEGYMLESVTVDGKDFDVDTESVADGTVITLAYTPDVVVDPKEDDDPDKPGDGIPDKYQAVVNYLSSDESKGAVEGETVKVFTLRDANGFATSASNVPGTDGVTLVPNAAYNADGWDADPMVAITMKGGEEYDYYAQWLIKTYPVEFDVNGGDRATQPEDQEVEHGSTAAEPEDPTYDGYTFDGWVDEDGNVYDFDTPVTEPTKLVAKWSPIMEPTSYVVEHVYEGDDSLNQSDSRGSEAWVKDDPKMIAIEDGSIAPIKVEGYMLESVTVDGKAFDVDTKSVVDGTTITLAYTPDVVADPNEDEDPDDLGDGIPDKYQAIVHYVSADAAQGNVDGTTTKVFTLPEALRGTTTSWTVVPGIDDVETVPVEGYEHDHWTMNDSRFNLLSNFDAPDESDSAADPEAELVVEANGEYVFIANWKLLSNDIKVSFVDESRKELEDSLEDTKYYGDEYDVTSDIPDFITIDDEHNYVKETVEGEPAGTMKGEDIDVIVTYSPDNVVDPSEDSDPDMLGDGIPDKYQAIVRYVSADEALGTVDGVTTKVFTLRDDNGFATSASITPGTEGVDLVPSETYVFAGWDIDPDVAFTAEGNKTYTYTANWKLMTYPVEFDVNGGDPSSAPEDQDVEHGTPAEEPSTEPTRPGYEFDGWYDEDGNPYDFDTPVTEPIKLIARWTPIPPTPIDKTPAEPLPDVPAEPSAPTATPAGPMAAFFAPVADAINDLLNPTADVAIDEDGNPLFGLHAPDCWTHWLMIFGALVTMAYALTVLYRRRSKIHAMDEFEDEVMGEGKENATTTAPAAHAMHRTM